MQSPPFPRYLVVFYLYCCYLLASLALMVQSSHRTTERTAKLRLVFTSSTKAPLQITQCNIAPMCLTADTYVLRPPSANSRKSAYLSSTTVIANAVCRRITISIPQPWYRSWFTVNFPVKTDVPTRCIPGVLFFLCSPPKIFGFKPGLVHMGFAVNRRALVPGSLGAIQISCLN